MSSPSNLGMCGCNACACIGLLSLTTGNAPGGGIAAVTMLAKDELLALSIVIDDDAGDGLRSGCASISAMGLLCTICSNVKNN